MDLKHPNISFTGIFSAKNVCVKTGEYYFSSYGNVIML